MLRCQVSVGMTVSVVCMHVVIFQMVVMPVSMAVQRRMIMVGQEVQSVVRDLQHAV